MRKALLAGVVAMVAIAMTVPASADVSESFFSGGADASAGWVAFTPAPPGSGEDASIALEVNSPDGYAGVEISGVGTAAPATPPSFAFRSNATNAGSGGSPRLVIGFDDGGNMQLRPLSWTADTWVTIDGAITDSTQGWDNAGGSCGFLYNTTYATALGCHSGANVTSLFVVSDSGWLHAGGYIHYIDDISYDGTTVSYPTACLDDFTGSHETGTVSSVVHDAVEPASGPAASTVHGVNCDIVAANGL